MEWLIDERLYYGGLIGMAVAVVAFLICLCIFIAGRGRLRMKLRDEYGDLQEVRKY